jgi:hypothetical protein
MTLDGAPDGWNLDRAYEWVTSALSVWGPAARFTLGRTSTRWYAELLRVGSGGGELTIRGLGTSPEYAIIQMLRFCGVDLSKEITWPERLVPQAKS